MNKMGEKSMKERYSGHRNNHMGNLLDKQGMPVMIGRVVTEMMFEKIKKSLDNESTRQEVKTNNI